MTVLLACVAVALGVAASATIFSAANAALLGPLPYPEADRFVVLTEDNAAKGLHAQRLPPARYLFFQDARDVFEILAGYDTAEQNLTGIGEPERVRTARISAELFAMTGVRPVRGRMLTLADAAPGAPAVALIAEPLWRRRMGSGSIEGRQLRLDGQELQIVGVLPDSFDMPGADIYTPLAMVRASRVSRHLNVVGRLAHGMNLETARMRVATLSNAAATSYAATDAGWTTTLTPLRDHLVGHLRPALRLLAAAALLVAVIACASVANLLIVRFVARRRELAIRVALGATRGGIVRLLASEGLLVGLCGSAAGALLVQWLLPQLSDLGATAVDLHAPSPAWLIGAGLAIALTASLAPIAAFLNGAQAAALTDAGRGATSAVSRRFGRLAVVVQIALALALTGGAALLAASLARLARVDPGFQPSGVLTTRVAFPRARYRGSADLRRFEREVLAALRALPGVEAAGLVSVLPLSGRSARFNFLMEERAAGTHADLATAEIRAASPGYFHALAVPVVAGRSLDDRDSPEAPGVLVVNETMARRYWPDGRAIGRRVSLSGADGPWLTIVGIARDVKHDGLASPADAEMYRPFSQEPWPAATVVVRSTRPPETLIPELTRTVRAIDPELALHDTRTMTTLVDASLKRPRLWTSVLGAFGVLALMLALTSVFGVMAHSVNQRVQEIAVRIALGAQPGGVLRLIVGEGVRMLVSGAGLGVLGAALLSGFIRPLLFGVSARDPLVFAGAAGLVIVAGIVACYLPARRAAAIAPAEVLRSA